MLGIIKHDSVLFLSKSNSLLIEFISVYDRQTYTNISIIFAIDIIKLQGVYLSGFITQFVSLNKSVHVFLKIHDSFVV